eukprot:6212496-Pleurochrysis_carterae.AAC.3
MLVILNKLLSTTSRGRIQSWLWHPKEVGDDGTRTSLYVDANIHSSTNFAKATPKGPCACKGRRRCALSERAHVNAVAEAPHARRFVVRARQHVLVVGSHTH